MDKQRNDTITKPSESQNIEYHATFFGLVKRLLSVDHSLHWLKMTVLSKAWFTHTHMHTHARTCTHIHRDERHQWIEMVLSDASAGFGVTWCIETCIVNSVKLWEKKSRWQKDSCRGADLGWIYHISLNSMPCLNRMPPMHNRITPTLAICWSAISKRHALWQRSSLQAWYLLHVVYRDGWKIECRALIERQPRASSKPCNAMAFCSRKSVLLVLCILCIC